MTEKVRAYHRKKDGSASIMETFKTESGVMIAFESRDAQGNRTNRSAILLSVQEALALARELELVADELIRSSVEVLERGQQMQKQAGQAQSQSGTGKQQGGKRVEFKQV
ncbi:MAG: hypothetical protein QXX12_00330 [Nanopusillaceae archaeon]